MTAHLRPSSLPSSTWPRQTSSARRASGRSASRRQPKSPPSRRKSCPRPWFKCFQRLQRLTEWGSCYDVSIMSRRRRRMHELLFSVHDKNFTKIILLLHRNVYWYRNGIEMLLDFCAGRKHIYVTICVTRPGKPCCHSFCSLYVRSIGRKRINLLGPIISDRRRQQRTFLQKRIYAQQHEMNKTTTAGLAP
jgi:hypothetical protein